MRKNKYIVNDEEMDLDSFKHIAMESAATYIENCIEEGRSFKFDDDAYFQTVSWNSSEEEEALIRSLYEILECPEDVAIYRNRNGNLYLENSYFGAGNGSMEFHYIPLNDMYFSFVAENESIPLNKIIRILEIDIEPIPANFAAQER